MSPRRARGARFGRLPRRSHAAWLALLPRRVFSAHGAKAAFERCFLYELTEQLAGLSDTEKSRDRQAPATHTGSHGGLSWLRGVTVTVTRRRTTEGVQRG